MDTTITYNLPDISLYDYEKGEYGRYKIWVPEKNMVIVGRGSNLKAEVNLELTQKDNVSVIRRDSGGCSVFLSPNMVVASFALYGQKLINPMVYFRLFNGFVIKALSRMGLDDVEIKGISDLVVNGKKISGSSIYRNKNLVLFHIVINLSEKAELIGRYLKHPPKEPDYRKGRSHQDFVASIQSLGLDLSKEDLEGEISLEWDEYILRGKHI
jgi:lipoate---protein ligase